jgi:hypothetical protein
MTKIIQTKVDTNGDVHLEFSGFVGHDCQTEEERLRRELASLGLNVNVKLSPKSLNTQAEASQQSSSFLQTKA